MDYPTFGIPMNTWTLFNQLQYRHYADLDSNSVGSGSPPPSPLSPSPSLVSSDEESSFHFLPMLSPTSSADGKNSGSDLCQEVPALLGLTTNKQTANKGLVSKSVDRPANNSGNNGGFYKRLLEWLSRKKKTHRRYSELPLPSESCRSDPNNEDSHHLTVGVASHRNQSAPMIFDVQRSSRIGSSRFAKLETCSSQQNDQDAVANSGPAQPPKIQVESEPLPSIVSKQDSEDKIQEIDAEWIIPWSDIQVGEVISRGRSCTINRGRWHGDVIIHHFDLQDSNEITAYWSDVQSLSKLRHENLLLFMGIATESPSYTIVNSAPRGASVASFRLVVKNGKPERIGMRAAISIGRQVAQATGYLHARGIVHGKLNPHNIFLEGDNYRVKLSLLDHGLVDTGALKFNYGCLLKTQVGYYSPELVRSMIICPPEIKFSVESTKFSDVYAFGSFLYDLICGSSPFHQEEVDSILWRIGSGQTANLQDIDCNARLKALIASCWAYDPTQRPSFVEIVRRLQPSALLCRSHSCSEPERLNRLGMCKLAC